MAGLLRVGIAYSRPFGEAADLFQSPSDTGRVARELDRRSVGEELPLARNGGLDEAGEEHPDVADHDQSKAHAEDGGGTTAFVAAADAPVDPAANMRVGEGAPTKVSHDSPVEEGLPVRGLADVAEVKSRGVLRVGFRPRNVPFSYYNDAGELVGFDVELATMLARDLDVTVEFVAFAKDELVAGLDNGYFDIAASGLAVNVTDMQMVIYTDPVLELNRSIVVPDHRVKEFAGLEKLSEIGTLTLAYAESDDLIERVTADYPVFTFEKLDDDRQFFRQEPGTWDALLISAQAGSAWTLFYPQYGVAMIKRDANYPAAWAIARDNPDLLRFVDNWLALQRIEGQRDRVYRYWILGQGAKHTEKRWSIIRNVLGWVD